MWPGLNRWRPLLALVTGNTRASLCVHPGAEIWLGVSDFLSDPVPARAITFAAPDSHRFHFNAKKARYLRGLQQWL
jgi:hypothetical protein